jgi:hypothetical protein
MADRSEKMECNGNPKVGVGWVICPANGTTAISVEDLQCNPELQERCQAIQSGGANKNHSRTGRWHDHRSREELEKHQTELNNLSNNKYMHKLWKPTAIFTGALLIPSKGDFPKNRLDE